MVLGFVYEVQIYTSCRTISDPPNLLEATIKRQGINTMMSIVPCRRQNNLHDQQSTNKENIPPTLLAQVEKPTKINKVPSLTQRGKWTYDALEATTWM
jgi:hypothetical protein